MDMLGNPLWWDAALTRALRTTAEVAAATALTDASGLTDAGLAGRPPSHAPQPRRRTSRASPACRSWNRTGEDILGKADMALD